MTETQLQGVLRFVDKAHSMLDRVTYYQILNLAQDCQVSDVRKSYFKLAQRLHPDLYGRAIDAEAKARLTAVYSRVVEAYQVLTDSAKRKRYDELISEGKNRFTGDDAKARKKAPEDSIQSEGAKKFYKLGVAALSSGDTKSAAMNLKMALSMEPASNTIKEALARVEAGGK